MTTKHGASLDHGTLQQNVYTYFSLAIKEIGLTTVLQTASTI